MLALFVLFKSFGQTSVIVYRLCVCKPTLNCIMLIQGHNAVSQGSRVKEYQIHVIELS